GNPMMPPQPQVGSVSKLDHLFEAWGVTFESTKVLADMMYRTPLQGGVISPTVLGLSQEAFDTQDVVTSQLQDVSMIFAGGMQAEPAEGLELDVLIRSSGETELVSPDEAEPGPEFQNLIDEFAPSGTSQILALRLSGNFVTAFPKGDPVEAAAELEGAEKAPESDDAKDSEEGKEGEEGEEGKEGEKEKSDDSLAESVEAGVVVIFSDADFIYDQFAVRQQNLLGQRILIPLNSNLTLLQNTVEQLSGDVDLIGVRSRSSTRRPFTRINEIQHAAEQRYSAKIQDLEAESREAESRLNELQVQKGEGQQFVLSTEQQAEIEDFLEKRKEVNRELREVRKDLRRDIDSLVARLKFTNILAMPVIVIAIGVILALSRRARRAAR
ncbi:MAG: hypothetical protein ACC661_07565, partial [Verrucomicrobiales bacterium]